MNLKHRIERSLKPRFALVYPFGLLMLFFGHVDEHSLRAGIGCVIAGMLIRLWSNGFAIKNDKLTVCGPYAFVRNPLYLGTSLIALGMAIVLSMGWFILLFVGVMTFIYVKTIKGEQKDLEAKFGDDFRHYCSKVPAFFPTLVPYQSKSYWPFSLERLYKSKEHKVVIWITILIIIFHLKSRLFLEGKAMTTRSWMLIGLVAVLILLDILYEATKNKIKTS